jgi:hypothetical protein
VVLSMEASPLNPVRRGRSHEGEHTHKSLIALVAAAGIGIAPAPGNADCIGCAVGAAFSAASPQGAIVGSAIANSPPPGYYPPPPVAYYGPSHRYYAYGGGGRCGELRQACLHKQELGEVGQLPHIPGILQIVP